MAEKNSAQTNKQTNKQTNRETERHYENNGHLAANQNTAIFSNLGDCQTKGLVLCAVQLLSD